MVFILGEPQHCTEFTGTQMQIYLMTQVRRPKKYHQIKLPFAQRNKCGNTAYPREKARIKAVQVKVLLRAKLNRSKSKFRVPSSLFLSSFQRRREILIPRHRYRKLVQTCRYFQISLHKPFRYQKRREFYDFRFVICVVNESRFIKQIGRLEKTNKNTFICSRNILE